jgi:hypothetical protein
MFEGPRSVIRVGRSAGASFQKAQGGMLTGSPAVSGYRALFAATARSYPASGANLHAPHAVGRTAPAPYG